MNVEETRAQFLNTANKIKSLGYRVFINSDYTRYESYYGYYSNGFQVAYFEYVPYVGTKISTVNAPGSHGVGTGFVIDEAIATRDLTKKKLQTGFLFAPAWFLPFNEDRIVKFNDLAAFLSHHEKTYGTLTEIE